MLNRAGRLVLDSEAWNTIKDVQKRGNDQIRWVSDKQVWGVDEKWTFPKDSGRHMIEDCDGFTLWKMRELMRRGLPASCLLFTIVRTETGEGHAILCVATDRGDYLLDNRYARVMSYDDLVREGYRFLYRSKGGKLTGRWDKIRQ